MPPIPPDVLRDTFFIWMYVTVTVLENVKAGKTTAAQILQGLEQGKHIKTGDATNRQTVVEAVQAVNTSYNQLFGAKTALKTLTVISTDWAGGGPHPPLGELDSVYIPARS
jgi:hypothetical protein